jgi:hypothetical protein
MAMKINQNRTFKAPVTVNYYDNAGNLVSGGFTATFKTLKMSDFDDKTTKFIDAILVGVEGIDMSDDFNNVITGDALVNAVKNDTDLASSCITAFNDAIEKKAKKPTLEKPSAT